MKTLLFFLLISLSLLSCKKKDVKPSPPQPDPVPVVVCTEKAPTFVGAYYTYNTGSVDTCYITFIENSCGSKYRIVNLSGIFNTWAVGIQNRDYYPKSSNDSKASITDTLNMEFVQSRDFLLVSVKSGSKFTPNLSLKKRK